MALATFIPGHPPYFKIQFHTQAIKYRVVGSTICIGPFPRFNSYEEVEAVGGPFWYKKGKTMLIEMGRGHYFGLGIHMIHTLMYDTSE